METLTTAGIEVQVETFFQPQHSNAMKNQYLFAYHITLFNHNNFTVQLLSRKWKITDANFDVREVEGEGVVGRQPVLYPGDSHQYVSGCDFAAPLGKMEGIYIFENKATGTKFEVIIPPFVMAVPAILN